MGNSKKAPSNGYEGAEKYLNKGEVSWSLRGQILLLFLNMWWLGALLESSVVWLGCWLLLRSRRVGR